MRRSGNWLAPCAGRRRPGRQQLNDLLVIISELTTNAVLHGAGRIRLRVRVEDGRVYGEVVDDGSGFVNDVRGRGHRGGRQEGADDRRGAGRAVGIHDGSSHVWFELTPGDDRDVVDPELGTHQRPPQLD